MAWYYPDFYSRDSKSQKGGSTMKKLFERAVAHAEDVRKLGEGFANLGKAFGCFGDFARVVSEFLDSYKPRK